MTANQYQKIINYFKKNKIRSAFLILISKVFPYINALTYMILVCDLFFTKSDKFYKVVFIPAFVFLFVTIFRRIINKPRPYDELEYSPFFNNVKRGKGKSFPSRHTASAVIIAISTLYVNIYLGIFAIIISLFIAVSRVLIGVHYPRDVISALLISSICGVLGFYLF